MTRTAATIMGLHAQTALHPGAGTALGLVDLPIQRERHTGWPTIPGSALKGILRNRCRDQIANRPPANDDDEHFDLMETEESDPSLDALRERPDSLGYADATRVLTSLFGPPTQWASEFAGALSVTDARLIAFPVRSMKGVFAWVTCRAAMERLQSDAALAGVATDWRPIEVAEGSFAANADCQCVHETFVVLEEFDFDRDTEADSSSVDVLSKWLEENVMTNVPAERLKRQLIVLHDDDFTHFARYATEVVARNRLDYETKTAQKRALFYQEFLPTESVLYSLVIANPSRSRRGDSSATLLLTSLREMVIGTGDGRAVLQVGADETTGKGLCCVSLNSEVSP